MAAQRRRRRPRPRGRPLKNPALWLEPSEQRNAYVIAAASVVIFIAVWQPWLSTGRAAAVALSALFPAALAFAAWRGHRVWTAIAAFLLVFDPGWRWLYVLAAVPLAYAFLLARRGRLIAARAQVQVQPGPPPTQT